MTTNEQNIFYHTPYQKFKRKFPIFTCAVKTAIGMAVVTTAFYHLAKSSMDDYTTKNYTVVKGDNIYTLCALEGLKGDNILECSDYVSKLNNIKNGKIVAGQNLLIPDVNKDGIIGMINDDSSDIFSEDLADSTDTLDSKL